MASKSGPRIVNDSISLYVDASNIKSYNNIEQEKLTTPINWQSASAAIASNLWRGVSYAEVTPSPSTWIEKTAAELNSWQGVTYGDGKWVSVSSDGTNRVQYSTDDGISWTAASAAEQNSWTDVTYAPEHSLLPNTWTGVTEAESNGWINITYGDGKFVATSYDGTNRVMYSTDAVSYTHLTLPTKRIV